MPATQLLMAAAAAALLLPAATACGTSCGATNGTFQCDVWPGDTTAAVCAAMGSACANCSTAGGKASTCQVGFASITGPSPQLGVCTDSGTCEPCSSFASNATCTAAAGGSAAPWLAVCGWQAATASAPASCEWNTDVPCMCDGYDPADFGCVSKGGAPDSYFCSSNCGFASKCSGLLSARGCMSQTCSWKAAGNYVHASTGGGKEEAPGSSVSVMDDDDGHSGSCGGCACTCNGCRLPDGMCLPAFMAGADFCSTSGGEWCACQEEADLVCSAILALPRGYPDAAYPPDAVHIAAARELCAAARGGTCHWSDNATTRYGVPGQCGECFENGQCISGACSGLHECTTCSRDGRCSGHGTASLKGPGQCDCTCDAGWAGESCDYFDCTSAPVGSPCAACAHKPFGSCMGSDGFDTCTENGYCGEFTLHCQPSYVGCHNGGKVMGATHDLCYCDCANTGYTGPYCNLTVPTDVQCMTNISAASQGTPTLTAAAGSALRGAASDAADIPSTRSSTTAPPPAPVSGLVTVPMFSANDQYLKVRMCASPDHKCTGAALPPSTTVAAGAPSAVGTDAYVDCAEQLPPQQKSTLHFPANTTLLVFVSAKRCPWRDYEVWQPKGGWSSLDSVSVPNICDPVPITQRVMPANCFEDFPSRVCYESGGMPDYKYCAMTSAYSNPPNIPCTPEMCCTKK